MSLISRICAFALLSCLLVLPASAQQAATISGTVTDALDGQPLAGANVRLLEPATNQLVTGAATDVEGRYRIVNVRAGSYLLVVSFVGYQENEQRLTMQAGAAQTINVTLRSGVDLNTVVVTGSRQPEKVLDAPSSISVLSAEEIQSDVTTSSVGVLRNTTGVDMAQTGVDRQEMVLRGFNNAFSGATYVLTDYRHAAAPALAVNIYSIMPNMAIDLERIEVVRGPGSALYGAGVDAGVVHFFTKDPFTYPGTTVAISGGERAFFSGQFRHAGVVSERLGYKITGSYSQADDWELDPSDPADKAQLDDDAAGLTRNYDYQSFNVNGMLQYRFADQVSLTGQVGRSGLQATVLSGIGTVQAEGFGYTYGQLRLQAGDFFAQAYLNTNDASDSFVYGTGQAVVDNGTLYNLQSQYNLDMADGRQQFIVGVDAEFTRPDTEGTILGRNEDNDAIDEYGAYLQSTTSLTEQLDVTVALRGDYNSVVEQFQVSPRAALVFKPLPTHSLRATYNRAFSSPGINSLFLDIVAGAIPGTGITLRGRGAAQGYTFARNPAFSPLVGTDLVAYSLNPAALGQPTPAGLDLSQIYGLVYQGIAAMPLPQLTALLQAQGLPVNQQVVGALVALLSPQATQVQGWTGGKLMMLNPSATSPANQFIPVSGVADVDPLEQSVTQTIEAGYKGIFANKVLLSVDGYYTKKSNFVGPLNLETPFVFVPNLQADLLGALAAGIQNNAQLNGALQQLGLTPAQVAGLLVQLAGGQLPSATTPVAVVQPNENNPGVGQVPELLLTYRNFGEVEFFGVDVAAQIQANSQLSIFGNLSVVSDDFFDNEELNETNTSLSVALNAPSLKARAGFDYRMRSGLSFNASGRYTEGFPVKSGPYVGTVENYFLLDLGAGYDMGQYVPGLQLNVTVTNVLNNEHREFVGAPMLGRMALARLLFSF